MHKRYCPIVRDNCMGDKCQLWITDGTKVVNLKTHKSGIKDTSNCAFEKMGQESAMNIWRETERIINEGDGID